MARVSQRFCFLQPTDGIIEIKLSVSDHILAGGDFRITKRDSTEILEKWKMSADSGNAGIKILSNVANKLNFCSMVWQVLCCSSNKDIGEATLRVEILQGSKPATLNAPIFVNLEKVAHCQLKMPVQWNDVITFVEKK